MDRSTAEQKVRQVVADSLGKNVSDLTEGADRESHDWESIQNLNIILSVEMAFNQQFTPEQMETMHSIPRIVDVLMQNSA